MCKEHFHVSAFQLCHPAEFRAVVRSYRLEIVSASNPTKAFKNIEIKKNNERMSSREERKNYLKKELTRIETKIKKLQEKKKKIKEEYKNL